MQRITKPLRIFVTDSATMALGGSVRSHIESALPTFLARRTVPLPHPIFHGIGFRFICSKAIPLFSGRSRELRQVRIELLIPSAAHFLWG